MLYIVIYLIGVLIAAYLILSTLCQNEKSLPLEYATYLTLSLFSWGLLLIIFLIYLFHKLIPQWFRAIRRAISAWWHRR